MARLFENLRRRRAVFSRFAGKVSQSPQTVVMVFLILMFGFTTQVVSYIQISIIIQTVTMAVSGGVMLTYGRYALQCFKSGKLERDSHLILGITVCCLGTFLRAASIVWLRTRPFPITSFTSNWINFFNGMIMVGYILHLTAPGIADGTIPFKSWKDLAICIGIGVAFGWVLIWASINN